MRPSLTRRQQQVLYYLRERAVEGAPAPHLDEICAALGVRSRGSLHKHVRALVAAGLVEPMDGRQRGVRLSADAARADHLELLGRIAAGRPIEALAEPESVEVPARLRGTGASYVLEVRGDSMSGAGILDGDWVVIERRDSARDGEIVVALIDDEEATLKRIERHAGEVWLHPASDDHAVQRYAAARVRVQGVLVGLLRSYRGAGCSTAAKSAPAIGRP